MATQTAIMPKSDMPNTMAISTPSTWARECRFSVIVNRSHLLQRSGEKLAEDALLFFTVRYDRHIPTLDPGGNPENSVPRLTVIMNKEIVFQKRAINDRVFGNGSEQSQVENL